MTPVPGHSSLVLFHCDTRAPRDVPNLELPCLCQEDPRTSNVIIQLTMSLFYNLPPSEDTLLLAVFSNTFSLPSHYNFHKQRGVVNVSFPCWT